MRRLLFCIALMSFLPGLVCAQVDATKLKKEAVAFQSALEGVVRPILPDYGLVQEPRIIYLDGYGPMFMVDVALERAANPFFTPGKPSEVKQTIERRREEIKKKVSEFLRTRLSDFKSMGDSGVLMVVFYIVNNNPAYAPDQPNQMVFTAKRQNAAVDVAVHEYDLDLTTTIAPRDSPFGRIGGAQTAPPKP